MATMWPELKRPKVSPGSVPSRVRRNQSTSIGTPEGDGLEPRPAAHERVATVGGHGQSGRDLAEAVGGAVANAGYAAGLLKKVDHLGAHAQVEARQLARRIGQKVEEVHWGTKEM